jgi:NAD(P)-dependent dehydrogenase (short-subunit alcohol dehydrogenase family)
VHPHDRRLVDAPEGNHNASIVLTGATTGTGRATALALAGRAGHLILHGLERQDDVEDLLGAVRTTMRRSAGGRAETTGRSRGNRCCTAA